MKKVIYILDVNQHLNLDHIKTEFFDEEIEYSICQLEKELVDYRTK